MKELILSSDVKIDVPEGDGLWICLQDDNSVSFSVETDKSFPFVHPNCRAPASLTDVKVLKGGGSGTAVFHGNHPSLNSLVLKHGGVKDTREVMSLASISEELARRGGNQFMRNKLPRFVGVYISPFHLRDRAKELWNTVRGSYFKKIMQRLNEEESDTDASDDEPIHFVDVAIKAMQEKKNKRDIRIETGEQSWLEILFRRVIIHVERDLIENDVAHKGFTFLETLKQELLQAMEMNFWKVTLVQESIGDANSINGATVLTSGRLTGSLLRILLSEFTNVVQNLRLLTFEAERDTYRSVLGEIKEIVEIHKTLESVSPDVNKFVGSAIHKNFGYRGRFKELRSFGVSFRDTEIVLSEKEVVPAGFLGRILERGADPTFHFTSAPFSSMALDIVEGSWLDLLKQVLDLSENRQAVECMWTCGLTDAGLHNTFLGEDRGLELFDLGEPGLVSQPAFLTKFLMSFFHTMGMEESDGGDWIVCFSVKDHKLCLTEGTKARIPYLFETYEKVVCHLIDNLFDGDTALKTLLDRYVVLQILSDASFCLERWAQKGGGGKKYGDRAKQDLSKWLWRSLWDVFIASAIAERYHVK